MQNTKKQIASARETITDDLNKQRRAHRTNHQCTTKKRKKTTDWSAANMERKMINAMEMEHHEKQSGICEREKR
jgi:hypothetical protein